MLKEIADLPVREAYVWLRGSGAKAVRMTVNAVPEIPRSSAIQTDSQLADRVRCRLKEEEKRLLSIDGNSGHKKSVEEFLAHFEKEYPPNA